MVRAGSLALQLQVDKASVKEQASAEHVWLELDDMGISIGMLFLFCISRSLALVPTLHKGFLFHDRGLQGGGEQKQHPGLLVACMHACVWEGRVGGWGGGGGQASGQCGSMHFQQARTAPLPLCANVRKKSMKTPDRF